MKFLPLWRRISEKEEPSSPLGSTLLMSRTFLLGIRMTQRFCLASFYLWKVLLSSSCRTFLQTVVPPFCIFSTIATKTRIKIFFFPFFGRGQYIMRLHELVLGCYNGKNIIIHWYSRPSMKYICPLVILWIIPEHSILEHSRIQLLFINTYFSLFWEK